MKAKKPYYLGDYLNFILPFVKPFNKTKNTDDLPQKASADASTEHDLDLSMECEKSPLTEHDGDLIEIEPSTVRSNADTEGASTSLSLSAVIERSGRKRKRPIPEIDKTFIDYLRNKQKNKEKHNATPPSSALSQMDYFFKSITGEFQSMTEGQMRYFKIKTLQLIDKIKNETPVSPATPFASDQPSEYNCSPSPISSSHIKAEPIQYYYEDMKQEKPTSEEFFIDDVHQ